MKRISILFICLLLLLNTTACGLLKDDIYFLFTGDIHAYVDNTMNYANVKYYKDYLKKQHRYVTLIDGGDFVEGHDFGDDSLGKNVIEVMNEVGYDIVTLGNHEFDFGLEALKENITNSKFKYVCSNLEYLGDGEDPFKKVEPYIIKSYGMVKVAFLGALTANTLEDEKTSQARLLDENGNYLINVYGDINGDDDGIEQLARFQSIIDEVKSKVDYVVVISHLGSNNNKVLNSRDLIMYSSGIDLVLDAHAHNTINDVVNDRDGNPVVLFSTGKELNHMGLVTISISGEIKAEYIDECEKDYKIEELLNTYR